MLAHRHILALALELLEKFVFVALELLLSLMFLKTQSLSSALQFAQHSQTT
jgi:hypothetical protein